jgi:hypothetical protein
MHSPLQNTDRRTRNIPSGTGPTPAFVDGATAPTSQALAGVESDLDFEIAYRKPTLLS